MTLLVLAVFLSRFKTLRTKVNCRKRAPCICTADIIGGSYSSQVSNRVTLPSSLSRHIIPVSLQLMKSNPELCIFYFVFFFKSMPPAPLSRRQQSEQLVSGMVGVLDYLSKSWRVQESRSCCRGRSQGDTLIPSKSTRFGIKVISDSAASGHCSSRSLMLLI